MTVTRPMEEAEEVAEERERRGEEHVSQKAEDQRAKCGPLDLCLL